MKTLKLNDSECFMLLDALEHYRKFCSKNAGSCSDRDMLFWHGRLCRVGDLYGRIDKLFW